MLCVCVMCQTYKFYAIKLKPQIERNFSFVISFLLKNLTLDNIDDHFGFLFFVGGFFLDGIKFAGWVFAEKKK